MPPAPRNSVGGQCPPIARLRHSQRPEASVDSSLSAEESCLSASGTRRENRSQHGRRLSPAQAPRGIGQSRATLRSWNDRLKRMVHFARSRTWSTRSRESATDCIGSIKRLCRNNIRSRKSARIPESRRRLDLNRAQIKELEQITGIGPALAARIAAAAHHSRALPQPRRTHSRSPELAPRLCKSCGMRHMSANQVRTCPPSQERPHSVWACLLLPDASATRDLHRIGEHARMAFPGHGRPWHRFRWAVCRSVSSCCAKV